MIRVFAACSEPLTDHLCLACDPKGFSARPQEAEQGSRQSVGSPAATGAAAAGSWAAVGDGWARTEWREPAHGAAVWGAAAAAGGDAESWRARAAAACGGEEHWEEKDGQEEDTSEELETASQPTDEAQRQYSEVGPFNPLRFTPPSTLYSASTRRARTASWLGIRERHGESESGVYFCDARRSSRLTWGGGAAANGIYR